MARKYKSTGCARIFIVLIIVAPIAFIIASYINGSDPLETIQGLWTSDENSVSAPAQESSSEKSTSTADLQDEIRRLKKDVDYYKVESETYKKLLDECQEARMK